ncbi:hypothetical protein HU200_066036 [Digitaria exilis]|uniref:Uncharacterized protein n=1 Tax=Digitaria exilis TaxID=1010633 RepID=A0A835A0Y1_9POAL|nr:hypothetical protein HU200_066036 [Digitaria exilis]
MDSLGLSLFRPDFIITSFYRVFGADPTGFGCLLMIKKSVMASLQSPSGGTGAGMVRIVPVFPQYLSDSVDGLDGVLDGLEDDTIIPIEEGSTSNSHHASQLPAFSGAYSSAQVREVIESEMDQDSSDRDGASTIYEESESVSVGEMLGETSGYAMADDDDDDAYSDYDEPLDGRKEPEIICRHLDHVNMLGLSKTTLRLRYLINWLVTSLLQLRLPDSGDGEGVPLVYIYGPKIKYDRGAAVAFNIKDSNTGTSLINPKLYRNWQKKEGLSLGVGFLSHIRLTDNQKHGAADVGLSSSSSAANGRREKKSSKNAILGIEVGYCFSWVPYKF